MYEVIFDRNGAKSYVKNLRVLSQRKIRETWFIKSSSHIPSSVLKHGKHSEQSIPIRKENLLVRFNAKQAKKNSLTYIRLEPLMAGSMFRDGSLR